MEKVLNWRKGLFDSNYQVWENTFLKFSINFSSFKNSAMATTQEGIYWLRSDGYSNPETRIFSQKNELLAVIRYDWINFKAKIVCTSGDEFDWSYQNSWLSRWSINNHKDKQAIYNSSSGGGLIHSNVEGDLVIVAGLFIREYYSRILYLFLIIIFLISTGRTVF